MWCLQFKFENQHNYSTKKDIKLTILFGAKASQIHQNSVKLKKKTSNDKNKKTQSTKQDKI